MGSLSRLILPYSGKGCGENGGKRWVVVPMRFHPLARAEFRRPNLAIGSIDRVQAANKPADWAGLIGAWELVLWVGFSGGTGFDWEGLSWRLG